MGWNSLVQSLRHRMAGNCQGTAARPASPVALGRPGTGPLIAAAPDK